jgi:hypothetical protein
MRLAWDSVFTKPTHSNKSDRLFRKTYMARRCMKGEGDTLQEDGGGGQGESQ